MKPSEVFRKAAELLEHPMTFFPFACYAIQEVTGNHYSEEYCFFFDLYYPYSDAPKDPLLSPRNVGWWRDYDDGPRILALLFAAEFYEDQGQ